MSTTVTRVNANVQEIRSSIDPEKLALYRVALGMPKLIPAPMDCQCWQNLFGRPCSQDPGHDCRPGGFPIGDHRQMWINPAAARDAAIMTSETYDPDDAAAKAFAEAHGLVVRRLYETAAPYGHGTVLYAWWRA